MEREEKWRDTKNTEGKRIIVEKQKKKKKKKKKKKCHLHPTDASCKRGLTVKIGRKK